MSEEHKEPEQNAGTTAQFASFVILASLMSEIADGNGVIDVKRLMARLQSSADEILIPGYSDSRRMVDMVLKDMEKRLVKP